MKTRDAQKEVSVSAVQERDKTLARTINNLGKANFSCSLSRFVGSLTQFDNCIILAYKGKSNPEVLHREYKDPVVYLHMDSSYLMGAYRLDPFYHEHLKGVENGIRRLAEVVPERLKFTSYFSSYYQHTTLVDEVAVFANLGDNRTVTACFGKDRSSGTAFSHQEVKTLKSYEQVLSALIESQWKHAYLCNQPKEQKLSQSEQLRRAVKKETGIKLSPRQAEVAAFILQGHSSLSISLHLGISTETVKVFRRQLYAKCNISSQAELFAMLMPLSRDILGN